MDNLFHTILAAKKYFLEQCINVTIKIWLNEININVSSKDEHIFLVTDMILFLFREVFYFDIAQNCIIESYNDWNKKCMILNFS